MRKRLREDVFSDNNLDNQWLQNQFDKFNHQYFGNSLSLPYRLEFTDLGNGILGQYREDGGRVFRSSKRIARHGTPEILISNRFNMSIKKLQEVLLHEMVHYYVSFVEGIFDQHGPHFKRKCAEINLDGWTLSRTDDMTDTAYSDRALNKAKQGKGFLITVFPWKDGKSVCFRTKPEYVNGIISACQKQYNITPQFFITHSPYFHKKRMYGIEWRGDYLDYLIQHNLLSKDDMKPYNTANVKPQSIQPFYVGIAKIGGKFNITKTDLEKCINFTNSQIPRLQRHGLESLFWVKTSFVDFAAMKSCNNGFNFFYVPEAEIQDLLNDNSTEKLDGGLNEPNYTIYSLPIKLKTGTVVIKGPSIDEIKNKLRKQFPKWNENIIDNWANKAVKQ